MSIFFNRLFCREKLKFKLTNDEKKQVIDNLKHILKVNDLTINLTGNLKNDNEFFLTDIETIGIYIQHGGNPAILKGNFKTIDKINELTIISKSNSIFPFFSILMLLWFIPSLIYDDSNSDTEKIFGVIFIVICSLLMNLIGNYLKNRLMRKTLKELNLKK